jgi:hypothetical protein
MGFEERREPSLLAGLVCWVMLLLLSIKDWLWLLLFRVLGGGLFATNELGVALEVVEPNAEGFAWP